MELSKMMIECYTRGWISPRDGNISFKPANSEYYYITPAGINKSKMTQGDILKMKLSNDEIVVNNHGRKPSGEIILHTLILKDSKYDDKNVYVVHCHPPHILAYVGFNKNRELSMIKEHFPELSENIKIGKNVGHITARTHKLGASAYENIKNKSIVALKQHGVVAVGDTFEDIVETIETLEYYCRIFLLSKE